MEELALYKNDFKYNFRETERSLNVINHWYNPRVRYMYEDLPQDSPCLRLIAERLVVRRILGIVTLDSEYINKVSRVEVFGEGSPIYSELMLPNVFIAMALVPLSPCRDGGRPCLARLYCVGGLTTRHKLPLEGMDESSLQGFSWFLEGVPPELRKAGIKGRSWLSAAHLLTHIVKRKDKKTARNLAKNFIVTGDIRNGQDICKVEMGRKEELAKQKHFNNFKWIIPKENDMNIPKRKIEKPETLEEAYKLIESMRNTATKSFFRFLREGNLDGVKEQYKIGADIYGREEKTDLTCLEVVTEEKAKLFTPAKKNEDGSFVPESVELEKYKQSVRESIDVYTKIDRWLRINGADAATMFYLLAKNEDEEGIIRNREKYSINEHGHTAVDIALIMSEYEVAKLLHKCGGLINSRWRANKRIVRCINVVSESSGYDYLSEEDNEFLGNALGMGLSPDMKVSTVGNSISPIYGTLFGEAVRNAHYQVAENCLKNGADVNKELVWTELESFGPYVDKIIVKKGTPWSIITKHMGIKEETLSRFKELFVKYGARIPIEK